MKENIFYLNGRKIRSLNSFGKELRNTFYFEEHLNLKNLNVINDVLRGGYGILAYNEVFTLIWQKYKTSERFLDKELLEFILEILNENSNITLIFE